MTQNSRRTPALLALGAGLVALGACASAAPTAVPQAYLEGTALDRNPIGVTKRTAFLEVAIHPEASELSNADRDSIRTFIREYAQSGHGPLVLSLPQASANPQLAVAAVTEARAIAWEQGVAYSEIAGTSHGAGASTAEPMILAYQAYDAVAPVCPSKASFDISDVRSNNTAPDLGCAVRSNLAAMIADPADLLGQRPIDPADMDRRTVIMEKFREGEPTGATRGQDEDGAVSRAVQ